METHWRGIPTHLSDATGTIKHTRASSQKACTSLDSSQSLKHTHTHTRTAAVRKDRIHMVLSASGILFPCHHGPSACRSPSAIGTPPLPHSLRTRRPHFLFPSPHQFSHFYFLFISATHQELQELVGLSVNHLWRG